MQGKCQLWLSSQYKEEAPVYQHVINIYLNIIFTSPTSMIAVGTSGYSYKEWIQHFYPKGTKQGEFLEYYSKYLMKIMLNS